ncbi:MAG TPA: aryl-sulfate sulfotransferase [Candidatus Onthousia faecavium]|nr:aryl-sulfate sulfotransferase [Candidatus Onthousia faecavium]
MWGYESDWIHLNSLYLADDIVLSSRKFSTIIYISSAYTNSIVKYLLTDKSATEKTHMLIYI